MATDEHALLLQISFDLARLQKQSANAEGIVDKGLTGMEKRAKKAAQNIEESLSLKGVNPGLAINSVLGGIKSAALEEGAAQLGVFGGALEALGPIGLAAGAGVAAFGFAVEKSLKTSEWALDLEHVSGALGLTTTQLQRFDFIAASAGIPVDKMRESMGGLVKTIGLVESGLARSMSVKAFTDGLKITPEQLRGWGTLQEQLPHILDAAAKLNVEERAGLASRLKVDPEVLNGLIEMRDHLGEVTDAANQFGVMSDADVKKSADVARQMKITGAVIDSQLRQAFVNLAPAVLWAEGLVARFASGLVNLEHNATLTGLAIAGMFKTFGGLTGDPMAGVKGYFDAQQKAMADEGAAEKAAGGPPAVQLVHPTVKHHKGAADHSDTTAGDDLDAADKLLADANKALAKTTEARNSFEAAALRAEQAKADRKLDDDLKKVKGAANKAAVERARTETDQAFKLKQQLLADQTAQALADQANTLAAIGVEGQQEKLKAELGLGVTAARRGAIELQLFGLDEQLAEDKERQIVASKTATSAEIADASARLANMQATANDRRQATVNAGLVAVMQQQQELADIGLAGQVEKLKADEGLFQTTEKRRELALRIFDLEEKQAEDALKAQIAQAKIAGNLDQVAKLTAELANMQATAGERQQAVSQNNPGNAWNAWVQDAQHATADVGEAFAKMKVDAIDKFNSSLFDSEGRLNSFGQIARNVARTFITDFEQFGVKSIEAGLFGGGGGMGGNPLGQAGGLLGGLFGMGGKGKAGGGVGKPAGTAMDPIFVAPAQGALAGIVSGGGGAGASGGGVFGSIASGIGGLFKGIGSIFGFNAGGSLMVGGSGGIDRNLVMLRATAGERIDIKTAQQQRDEQAGLSRSINQSFHFPGASPDGFRRTRRQWSRQAKLSMQY